MSEGLQSVAHEIPEPTGFQPVVVQCASAMLDFPGFETRVAEIQVQNSDAIELARRMFSSWINRPIDRWLSKSDLPGVVLSLSYMLNVQACRQFRTVVELCRIGEGANANIIGRSLFETVLAAHFILAEKFYIVLKPKLSKRHGNPPKRTPLKWTARPRQPGDRCRTMSREKRALIFQAHCMAQGYDIAEAIGTHIFVDTGKQLTLDPKPLKDARKRIGPEWEYIQSHYPKTYSGLTLKALAEAAGHWFPIWYESMYPDQSRNVHGVDPISHLNIDQATGEVEGGWFSNDMTIKTALYCANLLFLAFTSCLNENIGLGGATDMLLNGYLDDMKKVYGYSPKKR